MDYLVKHALKNVWCNPSQDNQHILSMPRLTIAGGIRGRFKFKWDTIKLPDETSKYHLYHIGQLHPRILDLTETPEVWSSLASVCNSKNTMIDIYHDSGIQLPRFGTYFKITKNKDIVIAIKENDKFSLEFNDSRLFLRLYLNNYFSSDESNPFNDFIFVSGAEVKSQSDIVLKTNQINQHRLLTGNVNCFINGLLVEDINISNSNVGDIVEYVYDSSVDKIVEYPLNQPNIFDSILDNKGKYLLRSPNGENLIRYHDDVDFYLIDKTSNKGIYIHKNNPDTVRMVTHQDYSVVVSYIQQYATLLPNSNNLAIKAFIRKSGIVRELLPTVNRLNELYRFGNAFTTEAMLGVNSTQAVWRADKLEMSNYCSLMSQTNFFEITKDKVIDAYGYDTITNLAARANITTTTLGNSKVARMSYLGAYNSTVFEYDSLGKLLGYRRHTDGESYICTSVNCSSVEVLIGDHSEHLDEVFNVTTLMLDDSLEYRVYNTTKSIEAILNTDYSITNSVLTWMSSDVGLVRSNKKMFVKSDNLPFSEGVLEVPIVYTRLNGTNSQTIQMTVPMGDLDVFLNGYSLVEDIDYYFDSPRIIIVNKSYLKNTLEQDVVVRFSGFCDKSLKHRKPNETGFIKYNNLSDNNYFNIHSNRQQRLTLGGSLVQKESINFREDSNALQSISVNNGRPYSIKDIVVPIKTITGVDSYLLKEKSMVIDKGIEDYVSARIHRPIMTLINVVSDKHYLYSPFLSRILNELIDGYIDTSLINNHYDDNVVLELCKPFEWLLEYDPIKASNRHSKDYCVVHAHYSNNVINLDFARFRFISRVIGIYAKDVADISNHIRLI